MGLDDYTHLNKEDRRLLDQFAYRYTRLQDDMGVKLVPAHYKCYVYVQPERLAPGWSRDRIIETINAEGVPCYQGSCSEVYLEKAFDGTGWRPEVRLPVAKELGETSVMFLVHPTLTQAEVDKTCEAVRRVMRMASA
jgi:dTDP-4-amino-4,6-dideoxygalactose transaminase